MNMEATFERSDVYLRQRGIKASFQRVSIFDYLQKTSEHPSVSQIFSELHPRIPSLSRATVYNTINLFLKKKIVIPVQVEGLEARYDLAEPHHAHFHCQVCQKIYDIPADAIGVPETLKDFLVQEALLHYKGVCPQCR
jgi:Fur family transcriptional regulator, peroxide stress response regulator